MQIETGPISYDIGEVHHPFILDDVESFPINHQRRIMQKYRINFPGYPDIDLRYIAHQAKAGYKINCQINTEPLIATGLIKLERGVNWLAKFTDETFEFLLSTLRVVIELPDKTEQEAKPDYNPVFRGGYHFNHWTQTYPRPNGRYFNDLFMPNNWSLYDLHSQVISTRTTILTRSNSQPT